MPGRRPSRPRVLRITGDRRIAEVLSRAGAIVQPAYSWRLDGFANDSFSGYPEPSIVRTPAVQQAQIVCTLSSTLSVPAGDYYFGLTMYRQSGTDENLTLDLGEWGTMRIPGGRGDNRLHLYVMDQTYPVKGGERATIRTDAKPGTCRIENIVLLKKKPSAAPEKWDISHVAVHIPVDQRAGAGTTGRSPLRASAAWTTNWPAKCTVGYAEAGGRPRRVREKTAVCNHRAMLRLNPGRRYRVRISAKAPDGREVNHTVRPFTAASVEFRGKEVRLKRVPLHVKGACGGTDLAWPVTAGVPMPRGNLASAGHVRLLDPAGREVALQVATTARWQDGSVKWLLLDFQTPCTRGEPVYTLEYGSAVRRAPFDSPLQVARKPGLWTVDTGAMRLAIAPQRFDLFRSIQLTCADGRWSPELIGGRRGGILIDGPSGERFSSAAGESKAEVESAGPERVVIKVTGDHRDTQGRALFRYVARIHAYRGQRFVRLSYTFENDRLAEEFTRIRQLRLVTPLARAAGTRRTIGGHGRRPVQTEAEHVSLRQLCDDSYEIRAGRVRVSAGRRAAGWIDVNVGSSVRDGKWCAAVAVRDFWQGYPKALTVAGDAIEVELCPRLSRGLYPSGGLEEDRLYYYLVDGEYKLRRGVSKRHDVLYYFHEGDAAAAQVSALAGLFSNPPAAVAPAEWYCASGALGQIAPADARRFPTYERVVANGLDVFLRDRADRRQYGMLNFGDWHGERRYNWGNMEYDTPHAFALQFVRSGDVRFLGLARQAADHHGHVDLCRHSPDRSEVGKVYAHCMGHVGGYYPANYREMATAVGGMTVSHTWSEGFWDCHFLTGDADAREAALLVTDAYNGGYLNDFDFPTCRNAGWHLILALGTYQATGDPYCLNAAHIIVERVLERQRDTTGGWDRMMVPGHCFCPPPRHTGNAGFMVGVLLAGLKRYHQATGDPRVADCIVRGADYLVNSTWVKEEKIFRYTSCPKSHATPGLGLQVAEGLSYAQRLSGKKRLRDVFLESLRRCLAVPMSRGGTGFGKGYSMYLRSGPAALWEVARLRARM